MDTLERLPQPRIATRQACGRFPTGRSPDVSDGLSTDLARLCEASGCGAMVDRERVPPLPGLATVGAGLVNADAAVLDGGEEFALLFTADARESELSAAAGRSVYAIGRMTKEPEILLERAGSRSTLPSRGFDHFASR